MPQRSGPGLPYQTTGRIRFEELGGREFERLCFAYLLSAERWHDDDIDWYGQLGKDGGRDIWGVHEDRSTRCYQCANHQKLNTAKALKDIDKIVKRPKGTPKRFTLIVGGMVSGEAKDKVIRYAKSKGIRRAIVWGGPEFEERVQLARPDLLRRMFHGEQFPDAPNGLRALVNSDETTLDDASFDAAGAFAELDRRRALEEARDAACTDAQARDDFAKARRLLAHPIFPVREDAYLVLKHHIRCKHQGALRRFLMQKWKSRRLSGERDRCKILHLLGWASGWEHSKELMAAFRSGAMSFGVPLLSEFQGFFYDAVRKDHGSRTLVLRTLVALTKKAPPDQPTSTLLTLVQQLVDDGRGREVLLPGDWEQISKVEVQLRPTGNRFSQLVRIQSALNG